MKMFTRTLLLTLVLPFILGLVLAQPINSEVIIPETTKVADQETRELLTEFNSETGVLRFSRPTTLLRSLEVEDILVSEPSGEAAPYGYLRKITTIIPDESGNVVLITEQAALDQAIKQGAISIERELQPGDIKEVVYSTIQPGETQPEGIIESDIADRHSIIQPQPDLIQRNYKLIDLNFDEVLADADGDKQTKNDQFTINGHFRTDVKVIFDVNIQLFALQKAKLGVGLDESTSIELKGIASGVLRKEVPLAKIFFKPITFLIGPVPIVVVPSVDVFIGIDGRINALLTTKVEQSLDMLLGAEYSQSNGWKNISHLNHQFSYTPKFCAKSSMIYPIFS